MAEGRIILQDLASHCYLTSDRSWVKSCQEAKEFDHVFQALVEAVRQPDKHPQVVWCFRNPSLNLYFAVSPGDKEHLFPCKTCPIAGRLDESNLLLNAEAA